nr:MAG TPA: hypothetical protein [Caudoviricetes sp.]
MVCFNNEKVIPLMFKNHQGYFYEKGENNDVTVQ